MSIVIKSFAPPDKIVAQYIKFINRRKPCDEILDTCLLPYPKQAIIDACLRFLETSSNAAARENLADDLLHISFFQDGAGAESLEDCRLDQFTMDVASLPDADRSKLIKSVSLRLPHLNAERFIHFLILVQADYKQLLERCEAIMNEHASRD